MEIRIRLDLRESMSVRIGSGRTREGKCKLLKNMGRTGQEKKSKL